MFQIQDDMEESYYDILDKAKYIKTSMDDLRGGLGQS